MRKFLIFNLLFLVFLLSCKESPSTALPKLKSQLLSSDSRERNKAALQLGAYGQDAEPLVPSLIKLLQDENSGVRTSAAFSLRKIDTPQARNALDNYQK